VSESATKQDFDELASDSSRDRERERRAYQSKGSLDRMTSRRLAPTPPAVCCPYSPECSV